jgi:predicted transcriptional regulator
MKKHEVKEIIVPIDKNLSIKPSVAAEDSITEAIEILLNNDLKQIAVTRKDVVVGMIRLEDALKTIGLEGDLKAKGTRVVVIQGRKIVINRINEQEQL